MCSSDLNRKGKSIPMQFVTSGRHPYFILVDNRIFYSACMALGIKSRITKLKLLRLRTVCKQKAFNGREVECKLLVYPPLHHCRKNTNVSMVGKLEEKLIFHLPPTKKNAPVKNINSSMVETVKVKYTF